MNMCSPLETAVAFPIHVSPLHKTLFLEPLRSTKEGIKGGAGPPLSPKSTTPLWDTTGANYLPQSSKAEFPSFAGTQVLFQQIKVGVFVLRLLLFLLDRQSRYTGPLFLVSMGGDPKLLLRRNPNRSFPKTAFYSLSEDNSFPEFHVQ
ncbi:hypothetical protein Ddc_07848 [Ditylenchus destructor]|nr:hypothetical protein Ddc_07848 [Ditylenchus destructor]